MTPQIWSDSLKKETIDAHIHFSVTNYKITLTDIKHIKTIFNYHNSSSPIIF